jgi:hypothetical protein
LVLVPIFNKVTNAMRLSNPEKVMAAAMNNAPPTNARAELENPANAMVIAAEVPYITSGFLMVGAVPNKKAIKVVIMMALASYETASEIQTTTANAKMANMR